MEVLKSSKCSKYCSCGTQSLKPHEPEGLFVEGHALGGLGGKPPYHAGEVTLEDLELALGATHPEVLPALQAARLASSKEVLQEIELEEEVGTRSVLLDAISFCDPSNR